MTEEELMPIIEKVLAENEREVKKYHGLFRKTVGQFMGLILRENKLFNPEITQEILEKKLRDL